MDESLAAPGGVRPHPKFAHYPHQRDYSFQSQAFRPFVTFVNPPNYRSQSVNIDAYGMRENYDHEGRFIPLDDARDRYERCTVLLGGSVAFGVGATSDRATLAARLAEPGRPCLNLGIRAVGARQELAVFLALRHLLPPVDSIVIFSGINEAILAASERVALHPGYGAVFAEHLRDAGGGGDDPAPPGAPRAVHQAIDRLARRGRTLQRRAPAAPPVVDRSAPPDLPFEERFSELLRLLTDTIEHWSWLQGALDAPITYVLQPGVPWLAKQLGPIEQACLDHDLETVPALARIAPIAVHDRLAGVLEAACGGHGLEFHDANRWFDGGRYDRQELFFDIAHLTDAGNAAMVERLRQELTCFHA